MVSIALIDLEAALRQPVPDAGAQSDVGRARPRGPRALRALLTRDECAAHRTATVPRATERRYGMHTRSSTVRVECTTLVNRIIIYEVLLEVISYQLSLTLLNIFFFGLLCTCTSPYSTGVQPAHEYTREGSFRHAFP